MRWVFLLERYGMATPAFTDSCDWVEKDVKQLRTGPGKEVSIQVVDRAGQRSVDNKHKYPL